MQTSKQIYAKSKTSIGNNTMLHIYSLAVVYNVLSVALRVYYMYTYLEMGCSN